MNISSFTQENIANLPSVQPVNWPDISPYFKFYLAHNFCYPLKASVEDEIVGVGAMILNGKTAWLAHIIVHPDHQHQGIGYKITETLVKMAENMGCSTVSLIATEFGRPVYEKLGFEVEQDYILLKGPKIKMEKDDRRIRRIQNLNEIEGLDLEISGEERGEMLLSTYEFGLAFVDRNMVEGFYLPGMGEGLVYASSAEAGIQLLKHRCSFEQNKIGLPQKNRDGIRFLIENGFEQYSIAPRMVLGKKLNWMPSCVYSRAGGYYG